MIFLFLLTFLLVLWNSLPWARRAFSFSLRRLPSEVSLSMFTSSSSVLFLILFSKIHSCICPVSYQVVIVHWESLHESPSDHMIPTIVVALPLLLLSYPYPYFYLATPTLTTILVFVLSLSLNFNIWNGRPKMLYTQTLSLVYILERVLKSLHCHLSIWNCHLLAFRARKLLPDYTQNTAAALLGR